MTITRKTRARGSSEQMKVTPLEAVVCFMDVRGFSNFARQQMGDIQVAKYIQGLFHLFNEYICTRMPVALHIKGVGDGLLAIWASKKGPKDRTFFVENITLLLAQAMALHRAVSDGRLAGEAKLFVSADAPRNLGFGIFVGPLTQANLTLPGGIVSAEYIGTAINIAARLQDFSRPTGITIACVPDFLPPLRSAIQTVGPDLFALKELDASMLSGVLGDATLPAYVYCPTISSVGVIADIEERKSVDVVMVERISSLLTSAVEAEQEEAIRVISANRLVSFAEDLKKIAASTAAAMHIRVAALAAYYIVVGPAGLPLMQKLIQESPKTKEWDLAETSLVACSRFKMRQVLPTIGAILKDVQAVPASIQIQAIRALRSCADVEMKDLLCRFLSSSNWGIQQEAAVALAELTFEEKAELFGDALLNENSHVRFKVTLAKLLAKITTDQALDYLIRALSCNTGAVQKAVLNSLAELEDPRAAIAIGKIAEDNSAPIENRVAAIDALGRVGSPEAVASLLQLVKDHTANHHPRGHAIFALSSIKAYESIPDLLKIVESDDEHVPLRQAGLSVLAKLNAPEAIPLARGLLTHPDARLQVSAVATLGELNDRGSFEDLSKQAFAKDTEDLLRVACLQALLNIDAVTGAYRIIDNFEVLPHHCKCDVALEFGRKNCRVAMDFLVQLARSTDQGGDTRLQLCSIESLGRIRHFFVVRCLLDLLGDPNKSHDIRAGAAVALGNLRGLVDPQVLRAMLLQNNPDDVGRAISAAILDLAKPADDNSE